MVLGTKGVGLETKTEGLETTEAVGGQAFAAVAGLLPGEAVAAVAAGSTLNQYHQTETRISGLHDDAHT